MNRNLLPIAIVLVLLVAGTFSLFYKSGNCPMKSTVTDCTPRCIGDGECSSNQQCCPNRCGWMSCTDSSPVYTGSGYKGSYNQDVYCNGVKCAAYEKCQYDRNARREKCTRS